MNYISFSLLNSETTVRKVFEMFWSRSSALNRVNLFFGTKGLELEAKATKYWTKKQKTNYFQCLWINAWVTILMILSWILVSLLWTKKVTCRFVTLTIRSNISFTIIITIVIIFDCQKIVSIVISVSATISFHKYSELP